MFHSFACATSAGAASASPVASCALASVAVSASVDVLVGATGCAFVSIGEVFGDSPVSVSSDASAL